MDDALTLFYDFFDRWVDLLFNDLELFDGVLLGWVVVCCIVMGMLIKNVLALPKASPTTHSLTHYRSNGEDNNG